MRTLILQSSKDTYAIRRIFSVLCSCVRYTAVNLVEFLYFISRPQLLIFGGFLRIVFHLIVFLIRGSCSFKRVDISNWESSSGDRRLFLYFNSRGYVNSRDEIEHFALENKKAVIGFSETYIISEITDDKIRIEGYNRKKMLYIIRSNLGSSNKKRNQI